MTPIIEILGVSMWGLKTIPHFSKINPGLREHAKLYLVLGKPSKENGHNTVPCGTVNTNYFYG